MKRSLFFQIPIFVITRTLINTMLRMVYPFLPVFRDGLGVDLGMLSIAITLRSAAGVFGPLLASLGDTKGRKTGMLSGVVLFVVGALVMSVSPSYTAFVFVLLSSILGNLIFAPSMQAYLGDSIPFRRRGLVLGLTEFGWSLSFIIGVPLVGIVIERHGWSAPFPILGVLGILAIIAIQMFIPKDNYHASENVGFVKNIRNVFAYVPALAGIAVGLGMSAANELVNLTFSIWMEDTFHVEIAALAITSAIIGISELGGETLVTGFTDRIGKKRSVALGLSLNTLAVLSLPLIGKSFNGALLGLFFIYLTFEFTIVSNIPLMTDVLPSARATLMATLIAATALGRAFGAFSAPFLYTLGKNQNPNTAILYISLASALVNLFAIVALRYVKTVSSEKMPDSKQDNA